MSSEANPYTCHGYSFLGLMATMCEARVPNVADRARAITVVGHAEEVGSVARFMMERA